MAEKVGSQAPSYGRAASDATTIPATAEEIAELKKTLPQKAHWFSGWSDHGDSSKMDGFAGLLTKMIKACKTHD